MEVEDHTATLLDMGFTNEQIEVAKKHCADKSLDGMATWIAEHPNLEEFAGKEPTATAPAQEEPQGKSISALVNQDMSKELEAMGYSKNSREKALLMTSSQSIEAAANWLEDHRNDPDFEEEMFIVQEDNKPKLSPEEAQQKAMELQARLREQRKKREAEEEFEREKNRLQSGKLLSDAKRIMDEQQRQRDIEQKMKEKREDDLAKQAMLEQLERDRKERFGDKYVSIHEVQKEKPAFEQVQFGLKQMKTVYPTWTYPDQLKVCWTTIKTVLGNLIKNPNEPKFQTINLSNPNFKARVVDMIGGVFILTHCGFVEENGHLVLKKQDPKTWQETVNLLEKEISSLGQAV